MTDLYRLVYSSKNLLHGAESDIAATVAEILATSQRNNARAGVTGALMFNQGAFAQVLEGPQRAVEATFERIQRDPRHGDVTVLQCGGVDSQGFPNWSMAFVGQSQAAHALWHGMAAASGFDPSRLDGDSVFATLRSLVLEEEDIRLPAGDPSPRPGSDAPGSGAGSFDARRIQAELPRPGHALAAKRSPTRPSAPTRSADPAPLRAPQPSSRPIDPEKTAIALAIFRAALADERLCTTELRNELDEARVLLAESEARVAAVSGERDLWAERARLLATALCADASATERRGESGARRVDPAHVRSAVRSVA